MTSHSAIQLAGWESTVAASPTPSPPLQVVDALRRERLQSDSHQTSHHNIRDELDEVVHLNDVRVMVGEWIPFGRNHMVRHRRCSPSGPTCHLHAAPHGCHPYCAGFGAATVVKTWSHDGHYVLYSYQIPEKCELDCAHAITGSRR